VIHYHGTPITPRGALGQLPGRCFCVSYARPEQVTTCHQLGQSILLDNGAYTSWTQRKPTDWPGYYAWSERWLQYPSTWAVIPDVIDGTAEQNDALLRQWPHGSPRLIRPDRIGLGRSKALVAPKGTSFPRPHGNGEEQENEARPFEVLVNGYPENEKHDADQPHHPCQRTARPVLRFSHPDNGSEECKHEEAPYEVLVNSPPQDEKHRARKTSDPDAPTLSPILVHAHDYTCGVRRLSVKPRSIWLFQLAMLTLWLGGGPRVGGRSVIAGVLLGTWFLIDGVRWTKARRGSGLPLWPARLSQAGKRDHSSAAG